MWTLQSIDPADADLVFRLLPGSLKTIGRAPGVDFVVDAALVSRVHCRLTLSDANELMLEDLGSTNGTFLNGQKVNKATLITKIAELSRDAQFGIGLYYGILIALFFYNLVLWLSLRDAGYGVRILDAKWEPGYAERIGDWLDPAFEWDKTDA